MSLSASAPRFGRGGSAAGDRACVLAGDPRAFVPDATPDYASRPGFDRYVARLKCGVRWANDDGRSLLLSVPNVGHWSVVWDLLQGEFDYQPVGILCTTHLRFFTRRGLERLLGDARFTVERWEDVPSPPPAAFAALLDACPQGVAIDRASLATESFHVLARRD